jgi:16S rRNA (guanine527-N7)-methyltransferase
MVMDQANRQLVGEELKAFGWSLPEGAVEKIARHLELVVQWNDRINLTAITTEREMILKHVIDSASAGTMITLAPGMKVADVGTGAGFPGVILKCLDPSVQMVLMDSLAKRCKFLEEAARELFPANGYEVVWGRAEEVGQKEQYRERFDLVIARAVAELRTLSEYCLPLCRVGGHFLAMKGPAAREEVGAAAQSLKTLGGEIDAVKEINLPFGAGQRTLIRIKKVQATPKAYPRKSGTPAKSPL